MEIIRKKISLDKCKTRVNCALPYIPCNESFTGWLSGSSFGNFVSDIDENEELFESIVAVNSGITTEASDGSLIIRTKNLFGVYNQLLEILRNGLHLKHIKDQLCINGDIYSDMYVENFDYEGTTYDFLRNCEIYSQEDFVYFENGIYVSDIEANIDYVIVLDNFENFESLGGKDLINIVDEIIVSGTTIASAITPYIPINVLLTCDEDDLGLMTPLIDENIGGTSGLTPHRIYSNIIQVESKLQTLKCKNYLITDNGNVLNGCLNNSEREELVNGTIRTIHLELPFEIGVVVNKDSSNGKYTGDYLTYSSVTDDRITFVYYLGSFFSDSGYTTVIKEGTKYEETYQFKNVSSALTNDTIYNVPDITYYYMDIKYDESKVTVYNEDFNLYRDTNIGNIKEFNVSDVWVEENVINTPLIKEEYLMSANIDSNIKLNVEIDRGNTAAFEKHLILGECNTFSDLENYKNGLFNL